MTVHRVNVGDKDKVDDDDEVFFFVFETSGRAYSVITNLMKILQPNWRTYMPTRSPSRPWNAASTSSARDAHSSRNSQPRSCAGLRHQPEAINRSANLADYLSGEEPH
jgi:hypothetical protein